MLMSMVSFNVFAESDNNTKWRVNCDAGGRKLSHVIQQARPGDLIEVRGTCREKVTITTGPLTVDGGGNAVLDGTGVPPSGREFNGLVTVDGAQGVVLRGWMIRNSSGEGILGVRGASVVVEDTVIERNFSGITLSNSAAEIIDSAIRRNSGAGVDAVSNSTLILRGQIDISGNLAGAALTLNGNSLAEIRGGHVRLNNNGGQGIIVSGHSTLAVFGFQASQGSRLTASGNQGPGIAIAQGQLLVTGSLLPPASIVITSSANLGPGIVLPANGVITSPFGAARFVVENNPVGMQFGQGSSAVIIGGLQVSRNGTGIAADNAIGLTFVSIPPNPSAIQSNGTDITLGFGTKSTIDGVAVGTIVCDSTVLSRGTKVCP
jgi:hypothetical protein